MSRTLLRAWAVGAVSAGCALAGTGTAFGRDYVPAARSAYVYFYKYTPVGCWNTESDLLLQTLSLKSVSSCAPVSFNGFSGPWPGTEGTTEYYQQCPQAVPGFQWGYQHLEDRPYSYRSWSLNEKPDRSLVCEQAPLPSPDLLTRQFSYYCADSTNYELFQPAYDPSGPRVPGCRRKATSVDLAKQPRNSCSLSGPCKEGNPIDPATGIKYQRETDYRSAGPVPLVFERHYNNLGAPEGSMGLGWRNTYDARIVPQDVTPQTLIKPIRSVRVQRPDGQSIPFDNELQTSWRADTDISLRLTEQRANGVTTGWQVIDDDDVTETYDANGRLISVVQRSGFTQTITRNLLGQLVTVTDSFGRQLAFNYDTAGRVQSMTNPAGQVTLYGYSADGLLTSITYPDSSVRQYLYNESAYTQGANLPGAMTGILDETGQRYATFRYDTLGRAVGSEHAGGAGAITVSYSGTTSATVTDAAGAVRTYTMAVKQNVNRVTAITGQLCLSCGQKASYAYNPTSGLLNTLVDAAGRTTTINWTSDGRNLLSSRNEGAGVDFRSTTYQWHAALRLPTQVRESPRRTDFTYDAAGNVLTRSIVNTSNTNQQRAWTYTYAPFGRVLTENGPRTDVADVTTYAYYACTLGSECGQLQSVTNALGQVTSYTSYDAHGQPLSITDPNGVVTTLAYDLRRRLTSRSTGGETTTFTYWPNGLLKRVTSPDATYVEYSYDAAQRLIRVQDGAGNYTAYTLDGMGNRTKEEWFDPNHVLQRALNRTYNVRNQLATEAGAANTPAVTTTFGYDAVGNLTSQAAPLARNTVYTHDTLDRTATARDPLNGTTTYLYNRFDAITTVYAPGQTTSYAYNPLGDLTQESSPARGSTGYTYDSGGNLKTQTDGRGKVGTYSYDALNRPTQLVYPDQTLVFGYDAGTNGNGRLTSASDANHSLAWSYDSLGRVVDKVQTVAGVTRTVSHSYFGGRLSSLTTPSGQVLDYTYDSVGRESGIALNGAPIVSQISYAPYGAVQGWTWGNGTTSSRSLDIDGKVASISSAGTLNYSYDDAFRITGITDPLDTSRTWVYGYDANDRLTSGSRTGLTQTWTYNAIGDRLTQGGTTSATFNYFGAKLNSVSGGLSRFYSYDGAGSVTSDGSRTFVNNDAGRMSSMTSAGVTTTALYNALGQRIRKSNASGTTVFVYDEAGHLLGEYSSAGALIGEYVWLGDTPVAVLRPNGGGVEAFYVHTDHLDTPRKVTQPSSNAVRWRWDSDAFGTTAANPDPSGLGAFVFNLRFPGQYLDAETGLHYNYFRDYDPQIGRYVQSDPIGVRGGVHTYGYVLQDPVSLVDPTGLVTCAGRWRKWGEFVPTIPMMGQWQVVPAWSCTCYWMCVPCRGQFAWSGDVTSLPQTKGVTLVEYSGRRRVNTGSAATRPTPQGPSRTPSGTMGGSLTCFCAKPPGPEEGCNKCYVDSNVQ